MGTDRDEREGFGDLFERHASRVFDYEREVLALCVLADLSYADAALALGVSVESARSSLARARRHLRDQTPELRQGVSEP